MYHTLCQCIQLDTGIWSNRHWWDLQCILRHCRTLLRDMHVLQVMIDEMEDTKNNPMCDSYHEGAHRRMFCCVDSLGNVLRSPRWPIRWVERVASLCKRERSFRFGEMNDERNMWYWVRPVKRATNIYNIYILQAKVNQRNIQCSFCSRDQEGNYRRRRINDRRWPRKQSIIISIREEAHEKNNGILLSILTSVTHSDEFEF